MTEPAYIQATAKVRHLVAPYLLPPDSPVKPILDQIFSSSRVLLSLETMKAAGFSPVKPRKFTHLIVTKHPALPGYVIKAYLDSQRYYKKMTEYEIWIKRIQGAQSIQNLINNQGWNHLFKVPQKWIYELPKKPAAPSEFIPKYYILVEEDMELVSQEKNAKVWKSHFVTTELLNSLYVILKTLGLKDCIKTHNIPFSRDGRIAFIDTQTFNEWPVKYKILGKELSKPNATYWKQLTKNK